MLKDPDATLPFSVDWSAWLTAEDDTADAATWTVPTGLTDEDLSTLADGKATVWLSGGTEGETYAVSCRLTTVGGGSTSEPSTSPSASDSRETE